MPSNTPQIACEQNIEVLLWRPSSGGLEGLSGKFIVCLRFLFNVFVALYCRLYVVVI